MQRLLRNASVLSSCLVIALHVSVQFVHCQPRRQPQLQPQQYKNAFQSDLRLVQRDKTHPPENSLKENFIPILPLCCNMIKDDVISYQCQNTLATSSQEVVFKNTNWLAPRHLVSTKKTTKFKLASASMSCKNQVLSTSFSLIGPAVLLKQSRSLYFSLDGYFKYENEYYRPDEYCISGLNDKRLEVRICKPNCSDPLTPCIQKCCGMNQIYSFGYGDNPRGCVDIGTRKQKWFPTLYHDLDTKLSSQELAILNPHIIHKFPTTFKMNCRFNKTTVFPHGSGISDFLSALTHKTFRNLEFRLRKDGWLLYPGEQHGNSAETRLAKRIDNYCVDGAQDYGESSEFNNLEKETVLFLCSGGVDEAFETPIVHPSNNRQGQKTSASNIEPNINFANIPPKHSPSSTIPPLSTSDFSTTTTTDQVQPQKPDHLNSFKDRIELDLSDTDASSSASLEIEIEDGVPINSIASVDLEDPLGSNNNPESEFIPAVLKVAVQVPQAPVLLQTTFNHNNLKDDHNKGVGGGEMNSENGERWLTIPTCCNFYEDVNDGLSHHCRNRRMSDKTNETDTNNPIQWMVPEYFTTKGKNIQFPLRPSPLKCGSGKFQFQGFIHSFEQARAKTSGEKRHGILSDGYLKYDNEFYSPEQYCVNGLSNRIVEVLICKPDCSMWETPCIKKCCGMDEIYNLGLSSGNRGCQPLHPKESKFSPTLYKSMNSPVSKTEMNGIQPHYVQKYPPTFQLSCFNKITLAFPYSQEVAEKLTPANSAERGGTAFKHLQFRFRKDGKLMYSYPDSDGTSFDAVFDRGEFCVDAVRDYGEKEYFHNNENQTILFICASEPHSTEK